MLKWKIFFALLVVMLMGAVCHGATATWAGSWSGGEGAGGQPDSDDDVVISSGDLSWTASLPSSVASWEQDVGYTGTVTFEMTHPDYQTTFTNLLISGDCVVSNGSWTHLANPNGVDEQRYWLSITIRGDLDLGVNAVIDVQDIGFKNGGPGRGGSYGGAAHGGAGSHSQQTFGDYDAPDSMGGAASGFPGGGVARVIVGGAARIDGTIDADGYNDGDRSAAGGSAWLTASNLTGSGTIRAKGGWSSGGQSGGGRVAVVLTGAGEDFSAFSGNLQAYGTSKAAAGTVCLVTGDGKRTLVMDQGGNSYQSGLAGSIPQPSLGESVWVVDEIIVRNGGVVEVPTNTALVLTTDSVTNDNGVVGYIRLTGGVFDVPEVNGTNVLTVRSNVTVLVDSPSVVTGDVVVVDGGVISHSPHPSGETTELYKMDLTIVGDLTIESNGAVSVAECGFANTGPGYGSSSGGAAHGGRGSHSSITYGSILEPVNLGSGDGKAGGGAIKLTVTGNTELNGYVSADGGSGGDRVGAGGSVWLTTGSLSGGGVVEADGKSASLPSGAGRISVIVTDEGAVFDEFYAAGGSIHAYGPNRFPATCGTVHRKYGGTSEILIDTGGYASDQVTFPAVFQGNGTYPAPQFVFEDDMEFSSLILTNSAQMLLTTNALISRLVVPSVSELVDLGEAGDTLTLKQMTINGVTYALPGEYTVASWRGGAAPSNVSGDGMIVVISAGTVIVLR